MKTLLSRAGGLVALALGLVWASGPALADNHQVKQYAQSVVNIYVYAENDKGPVLVSGSGSIISRDGYIVTNNHVVHPDSLQALDIRVFLPGETVPPPLNCPQCSRAELLALIKQFADIFHKGQKAAIVVSDSNRDLAVLKTDTPLVNAPLTITSVEPDQGDDVWAIGYPGVAQDAMASVTVMPTLTSGTVERIYASKISGSLVRVVQHSATINHGNSGGPLIDRCGRVVGVNTWSPGEESQGIFYGTAAAEMITVLQQQNIPVNIVSTSCDDGLSGMWSRNSTTILFAGGGIVLVAIVAGLILMFGAGGARRAPAPQVAPARRDAAQPVRSVQWVRFRGAPGFESQSTKISGDTLRQNPQGVVIGRTADSADMVVEHNEVSRKHARVSLRDSSVLLEDLGSTNGTRVNGKALSSGRPVAIADGDAVAFGPVPFVVKIE